MTLTNISKDHLNKLIVLPNLQELEKDKIIKAIQRNSNNYSKLKILFKQIDVLKKEIDYVVQESMISDKLEQINCKFKKIPGKNYYLYKNSKEEYFFSILSPNEWNTNNLFIEEYFYDYDHTFQKI
jgi:hypothetical protein